MKKRKTQVEAFVKAIDGCMPAKLLPPRHAAYMQDQANARLQQAKFEGVDLGEVRIGEDCLPVWEGFCWGGEVVGFHEHDQARLLQAHVSWELSKLMQTKVVGQGNKKLNEARESGLSLEQVWIGEDLLPKWEDDETSEDANCQNEDERQEESVVEQEVSEPEV